MRCPQRCPHAPCLPCQPPSSLPLHYACLPPRAACLQCSDNETLETIFTEHLEDLNKGHRFKSNKFK